MFGPPQNDGSLEIAYAVGLADGRSGVDAEKLKA